MVRRVIELTKYCPRCGGRALAHARLPGLPGPRPLVYDLDDLPRLAARLTLGTLITLVEVLPYKRFACPHCGHGFRLANDHAKDMVVGMLAALRPVDGRAPQPAPTGLPAPSPQGFPQKGTGPAARAAAAPQDWEPEGLDG